MELSEYISNFFSIWNVLMIIGVFVFYKHCIHTIMAYERGVLFRNGQVCSKRDVMPGLIYLVPFVDRLETVDIRNTSIKIPKQKILSKDSAMVSIDCQVIYKIFSAVKVLTEEKEYDVRLKDLTRTKMRDIVSGYTLPQILQQTNHITDEIKSEVQNITEDFGISIEDLYLRDISFPIELMQSLTEEALDACNARRKINKAKMENELSLMAIEHKTRLKAIKDEEGGIAKKVLSPVVDVIDGFFSWFK